MAQTFTLEEAAGRLALSPEEFKRRLKDEWKHIRSFRDGATLRFRANDIDELARVMGETSDPGLQLGPVGSDPVIDTEPSDEFLLPPEPSGPKLGGGPGSKVGQDHPLLMADDPEFVLPVDSGSRRHKKPPEEPTDSDVRLDAGPAPGSLNPEHSLPTEEIALDLSGPTSASIKPSAGPPSGKLTGPTSSLRLSGPPSAKYSGPPSVKIPSPAVGGVNPADGSSEFELSLDADDSDSFELNLGGDDDALGGMDLAPSSERGMRSGINLGRPADSGLSLEADPPKSGMVPKSGVGPKSSPKSSPKTQAGSAADSSDIDFELTLDGPSASRTGPKSGKMRMDSDSEFELSLDDDLGAGSDFDGPKTGVLDDEAKGDIFETDFELPAVADGDDESASQVVAVDGDADEGAAEQSDFDLAINDEDAAEEESASQVVLVDDQPMVEDSAVVAVDEVGAEEGASASGALRGVSAADEDEETVPAGRAVPMVAPKWGALPAAVLLPSLLCTFLGGLMSFELLRGMWGYHQPSPPQNLIVTQLADAFGMKITK